MSTTIQDVQATLDEQLRRAGVFELIEKNSSKVLDVPDGFFAELVIRDADRRSDVEEAVRSVQENLRRHKIMFEVLVRPVWRVADLQYIGPGNGGDDLAALRFSTSLISGSQIQEVGAHVPVSGLDVVREKLGKEEFLGKPVRKPENGDIGVGYIERVLRSFLEAELRAGGEAYWDPVRQPTRVLDGPALSSLLGSGTAFRDLRNAIDNAFGPYAMPAFLRSLSETHRDPRSFDDVLPHLSAFLGGPYGKGETFETSSVDLYNRLRPAEQDLLRYHFQTIVTSALAGQS
jgi:hypothetical protein